MKLISFNQILIKAVIHDKFSIRQKKFIRYFNQLYYFIPEAVILQFHDKKSPANAGLS